MKFLMLIGLTILLLQVKFIQAQDEIDESDEVVAVENADDEADETADEFVDESSDEGGLQVPEVDCSIMTSSACGDKCIKGVTDSKCHVKLTDKAQCTLVQDELTCQANSLPQGQNDQYCEWKQDESVNMQIDENTNDIKKTCHTYVKLDQCEKEYSTQIECLQGTKFMCLYTEKCSVISQPDLDKLPCNAQLSSLACKQITTSSCQYKELENQCDIFDSQKGVCEEAHNKKACDSDFKDRIQCMWVTSSTDPSESKCTDYQPKRCEGDTPDKAPLKQICASINVKCKWVEDKCQSYDPDKDNCGSPLNKYACNEIPVYCQWDDAGKVCSPYELNDGKDGAKCQDNRNKFGCKKSTLSCAWSVYCETFNNYTHNCEDNLSHTACKGVPFPCGWNGTDYRCDWYDDNLFGCEGAANEVACLIADKGCMWQLDGGSDESGTCVIDTQLQTEDSFWQIWDENDFNEEFIQQFFAEQQRFNDAALKQANEEQNSEESKPVESKEDTYGNKISIFGTMLIVLLLNQ